MVGTTLALLVLAAPITAQAGSYDCAKASTRIEKTICDDPGLSNLDDRLAASYRTQRARLGSTGAAWVKASQANWLRWMRDDVGFGGWRFDFVKGYGGQFTG